MKKNDVEDLPKEERTFVVARSSGEAGRRGNLLFLIVYFNRASRPPGDESPGLMYDPRNPRGQAPGKPG
jgi:hypothetical protein